MFKIKRSEVLDHAKEKNIYIDPSTLTDKQKKDPKFMESVCTELTPAVVAKAVQSLISSLNIKIRMVGLSLHSKRRTIPGSLLTKSGNTM